MTPDEHLTEIPRPEGGEHSSGSSSPLDAKIALIRFPTEDDPSSGRWIRWLYAVGIVATYCLACWLPAVDTPLGQSGLFCLVLIPYVLKYAAWWANPLFLIGICLLTLLEGSVPETRRQEYSRYRWVAGFGVAASLLAASTPFYHDIKVLEGYYLWQTSMVLLAVGGFHCAYLTGKPIGKGEEVSPDRSPVEDHYLLLAPGKGSTYQLVKPGAAFVNSSISVEVAPELAQDRVTVELLGVSSQNDQVAFLRKERHAATVKVTAGKTAVEKLSYTIFGLDGEQLSQGKVKLEPLKAGESGQGEVIDSEVQNAIRIVIGK